MLVLRSIDQSQMTNQMLAFKILTNESSPDTVDQSSNMSQEKTGVEHSWHEYFFRQEPEVDSPLEEEDSAQVECSDDVLEREGDEEGSRETELKTGADDELQQSSQVSQVSDVEDENCWSIEQDVHLHWHSNTDTSDQSEISIKIIDQSEISFKFQYNWPIRDQY